MPPCMTTSVCPSEAIASAAANGSIVSSVPLVRLESATSALAAKRPAVAVATVRRPRENTLLEPRSIVLRPPA